MTRSDDPIRDGHVHDRARRIMAEEGDPRLRGAGRLDPAAMTSEEAETVRANEALKAAARGESRDHDTQPLRPDLGEHLPPD